MQFTPRKRKVNRYAKVKTPLDVILLTLIFQPQIVHEWKAFKKTLFNENNTFFNIVIGLFIFCVMVIFTHERHRLTCAFHLKKYFSHIKWSDLGLPDCLRFGLQTIWLFCVQTHSAKNAVSSHLNNLFKFLGLIQTAMYLPFDYLSKLSKTALNKIEFVEKNIHQKFDPKYYLIAIVILGIICLTVPFSVSAQIVFMLMLWGVAMIARTILGDLPKLILITISLVVSTRYLFWRCTSTLNIDSTVDVFFGVILLVAEIYTWIVLLLGYFQISWPLHREPAELPQDVNLWPSVDIFIPTYNEDLSIVQTTTLAALSLDWPEDKLHVYILDDGRRPEFGEFAEKVGAGYITRDNNRHAKAGNINQALVKTNGEYLAIFDCDHIPVRSFLQVTMGWFLRDKKLALIQTPHHFYSPDPFERNIGNFKKTPNENTLFYGVVQDGNDLWNASFFCGSCAILQRERLLEVGGIAVETVTEDAHTALRLHRKGYTSAYVNVVQAAGLATETLSAHIGQRIRWARGMAQIFRVDNPLLGAGLTFGQRLCYANAMIHFLGGIPRLIFLLAPLGFLYFHSYLIYAPTAEIMLYALPAIVHSSIANSYMQGRHRYSFWAEIYETVLAWYIARPTTVALINPKIGTFNVTAKGGLIKDEFFDLSISKPYLFLIGCNLLGASFGVSRYFLGPIDEHGTVFINLAWTFYNLLVLGGAVSVAQETRQVRTQHRIEVNADVVIRKKSGHLICAKMEDYSGSGVGLRFDLSSASFEYGEKIDVLIKRGDREFIFPAKITNVNKSFLGVLFENFTLKQQLDYIQCTYSRSDAWATWGKYFHQDKPFQSIKAIVAVGFHGYLVLARSLPYRVKQPFIWLGIGIAFAKSLLPQNVHSHD